MNKKDSNEEFFTGGEPPITPDRLVIGVTMILLELPWRILSIPFYISDFVASYGKPKPKLKTRRPIQMISPLVGRVLKNK